MRYARQMTEIALQLESTRDYCVLCPITNVNPLSDSELDSIAKAHYKKIDLSDAIYVVNIDGYIGESVKSEIEYAKTRNKEIIYHVDTTA